MNRGAENNLVVKTARTEERAHALRLVFQHLDSAQQEQRVANALQMIDRGAILADGIRIAVHGAELAGAMIGLPVPGAAAVMWPPQASDRAERENVEDTLLQNTSEWLRAKGARLAEVLLSATDNDLAPALLRNGFQHVTRLWYLRHNLERLPRPARAPALVYQPYRPENASLFHESLLRTYDDSLDCPELNGVRCVEEIIAGHQAQGIYDPDRWWLVRLEGQPVGVLLLSEMPEYSDWGLSYLGVVPEARRQGIGRQLAIKALHEARRATMAALTVSVDCRNEPAWKLYQELGFQVFDQREVYLAIWDPLSLTGYSR